MSSPSLNPDLADLAMPEANTATLAVDTSADAEMDDEAPDAGDDNAKDPAAEQSAAEQSAEEDADDEEEAAGEEAAGEEPEVTDVVEESTKKEVVYVEGTDLPPAHWVTAFTQCGLPADTKPYAIQQTEALVVAHKLANNGKNPDSELFLPMLPEEVQAEVAANDDSANWSLKYHGSYFGPKGETSKETSAMAKKAMRSRHNTQPFFRKQSSADSPAKPKGVEKSFWLAKSVARAELDAACGVHYDAYIATIEKIASAAPTEWLNADSMSKELKKEKDLVEKYKTESAARREKNAAQQAAREKKAADERARQGKARKSKVTAARKNESDAAAAAIAAAEELSSDDGEEVSCERYGRLMAIVMQRARDLKKADGTPFKDAMDICMAQKSTNKRILAEQEAAEKKAVA